VTELRTEAEVPAASTGSFILLRTDFLLEDSLVKALVRTPDCLLVATLADGTRAAVAAHAPPQSVQQVIGLLRQTRSAPNDIAAVDLAITGPAELGSTYDQALRRRAAPFALPLTANTQLAAERQMFRASYKGVTDFVTKWLWPWPAFWATRWCAARGISANMVTAASLLLVLLAMWLFARGYFGIGLVAAWLMTFDTVDGKLARVTLTSSRIGNVFDRGVDPCIRRSGTSPGTSGRRRRDADAGAVAHRRRLDCRHRLRHRPPARRFSSGATVWRSTRGADSIPCFDCSRRGAIPTLRSSPQRR
jgi:hypothetical protein